MLKDKIESVVRNPAFQQAVKATAKALVTIIVINLVAVAVSKTVEYGIDKLIETKQNAK